MDLVLRFFIGGCIVSIFAVVAEVLKPKGFAGLFAAAPSVALATLALTVASEGKSYAAVEARSMIAGAAAFLLYAVCCVYFIGMRRAKAAPTTFALLAIWAAAAFGLWSVSLR
jgi:uncharacterized membrane protein (GlpM family)